MASLVCTRGHATFHSTMLAEDAPVEQGQAGKVCRVEDVRTKAASPAPALRRILSMEQ